MVTNLNKTKTRLKRKPLRRVNNPRYHSNYGNVFRHLPDSNKPFAFTQQYGRSLLRLSPFRSFDSEAIGHKEYSVIVLHQPTTLCKRRTPTLFITVVFVIFKFDKIIALNTEFVNTFFDFFRFFKKSDLI